MNETPETAQGETLRPDVSYRSLVTRCACDWHPCRSSRRANTAHTPLVSESDHEFMPLLCLKFLHWSDMLYPGITDHDGGQRDAGSDVYYDGRGEEVVVSTVQRSDGGPFLPSRLFPAADDAAPTLLASRRSALQLHFIYSEAAAAAGHAGASCGRIHKQSRVRLHRVPQRC